MSYAQAWLGNIACIDVEKNWLIDLNAMQVSMTLPRPELSETMGITYRRIPILAIGRDIYADTSLIASTLERRYPASSGYGSLFPRRKDGGPSDTGMIKTLVMYYFDRTIFPLAATSIPFQKLPETFLKDRGDVRYLKICRRTLFSQCE